MDIDASVFRDGMAQLSYLYLNGNQLATIPYSQISPLKHMKVLDLSYNQIRMMIHTPTEPEIQGLQISLDTLRLDWNEIEALPVSSFQHFFKVNKTYLNGNPIAHVEVRSNFKGRFTPGKIRSDFLRNKMKVKFCNEVVKLLKSIVLSDSIQFLRFLSGVNLT